MTTVIRLLKSCAMPPARRPTDSSFCAASSCFSSCLLAVMSRAISATPIDLAGVVADRRHGQAHVALLARAREPHGLVALHRVAAHDAREQAGDLVDPVARDEHLDAAADDLRRPVAVEALGARVPGHHDAVRASAGPCRRRTRRRSPRSCAAPPRPAGGRRSPRSARPSGPPRGARGAPAAAPARAPRPPGCRRRRASAGPRRRGRRRPGRPGSACRRRARRPAAGRSRASARRTRSGRCCAPRRAPRPAGCAGRRCRARGRPRRARRCAPARRRRAGRRRPRGRAATRPRTPARSSARSSASVVTAAAVVERLSPSAVRYRPSIDRYERVSSPVSCTASSNVENRKSKICWRSAVMRCRWPPNITSSPDARRVRLAQLDVGEHVAARARAGTRRRTACG